MRGIVRRFLFLSVLYASIASAQTYQAVLEGFDVYSNSFCSSTNRQEVARHRRDPGPVTFSRTCGANMTTLTLNVTAPAILRGATLAPGTNRAYDFSEPIQVGATLTNVFRFPNSNSSFNTIGISFADTSLFSGTPRGTCPDGVNRGQAIQGGATVVLSLPDCNRNSRQSISYASTGDGVERFTLWTFASASPSGSIGDSGQTPSVSAEVYAVYRIEPALCPVLEARAAARSASCPALKIDRIHLVQSIGDVDPRYDGEVPLIQGKPTVVRLLLATDGGLVENVQGSVTANGRPLTLILNPLFRDAAVIAHGNVDLRSVAQRIGTLDFLLPPELSKTASVVFNAEAWVGEGPHVTNSVTRTFEPSKWPNPFKVGYVPVCLRGPTGVTCPSSKSQKVRLQFRNLFPTPLTIFFPIPSPKLILPMNFANTPEGAARGTLAMLKEYFLASALFTNIDDNVDQVVFILPDGAGAESADKYFGEAGGLGQFWWLSTRVEPTGEILHGIGHNLGLSDVDENYSYSSVTTQLGWYFPYGIPNEVYNSSMSSLRAHGWIDTATFTRMHQQNFPTVLNDPVRKAGGAPETIVMSGQVSKDGSTGSLDPAFHVQSNFPIAASKVNSDLCLRYTVTGATFPDFCFDALPIGSLQQAYFALAAPFPTGTTRVALRKGSRELAALTTGASPQISIVSPQAGEVWQGTRTVRWSATGNSLAFRVEYSSDGGTTWQHLAGDLTGTQYEVDTAQIIGGTNVQFRVTASTGLDNVSVTSAVIQVPQTSQLTVPTSTLEFRNLTLGESETKDIEFTNTGTGRLQVTLTPPSNAAFLLERNSGIQLAPGDTGVVRVQFKPSVVGPVTSTLRINDKTVTLRGAAFNSPMASLEFPADTFDFGHVEVGKTKDKALEIVNAGGASLTVNSATASAGFSVLTGLPLTVLPGERANLIVRMAAAIAGVRTGQLTLGSTDPSRAQVQLPITAMGVAGAVPSATAAGVLNAASFKGGAVSPGEIVTIFGTAIGPPSLVGIQLDSSGKVATQIGQTRVLFDGVPAPLVYALAGQTSAIVPYSVAGQPTTEMVIEYQDRRSDPVTLLVTSTAPALFSSNSTGAGQGAILNQDYSVNTAANPTAKSQVIQLFGTGEGSTVPFGVDGALANGVYPSPASAVSVTIGGIPAQVLYAGAAPSLVAGVLQVNVIVPANAPSGNVPVVVTVGGVPSQAGLTVAIAGPVTAAPQIAMSPSSLDFGSLTTGQQRDLTVAIRNSGTANLLVSSITPSNPRFTVTGPATPFTVSAGGTQNVTVRFSPTAAGAQSGTLTIASNDSGQPSVTVPLTGTGAAAASPSIDVTPTSLDFGNVTVGATKDLTATVRNTGTATLSVVSLGSSNARITVVSPPAAFTVAAGASQVVTLRFAPTAAGAQTGTLTVASNDAARPSVSVGLTGTGVASTPTGPVIEVTPAALDFGNVTLDQSRSLTLALRNAGTSNLVVTVVSSHAQFGMVESSPVTVAPGATQNCTIRFAPAVVGAQSTTLTLTTNDPARPSIQIPMTGTGVPITGGGSSLKIGPAAVGGWPNGRTSDNTPPNAIDGSLNTFTWTTASGNAVQPSYIGLSFAATLLNRIRIYKDNDSGGAGPVAKNLIIEYTTSSITTPFEVKQWTRVTGLTNGIGGTELMNASAVGANGTVTGDNHISQTSGWASLSFDTVNATGIRIGFSNSTSLAQNHYRVYELEAYGPGGTPTGIPIAINQTVTSALTTSSTRSTSCPNCYAVTYRLTVPTSQSLDIRAISNSFDTYLVLMNPAGSILAEDDDSAGGTNARLLGTFNAGEYLIEVTSAFEGETGSFTLSVTPSP